MLGDLKSSFNNNLLPKASRLLLLFRHTDLAVYLECLPAWVWDGVDVCTLIFPLGTEAKPMFQLLSWRGVGTADRGGLYCSVGSQPGVWHSVIEYRPE